MSHRALFLDRDGVINVNHGYVHRVEDFEWIDGIFDLCRAATSRGYRIVIVTNQSGIARSYYTGDEFKTLMSWVQSQLWQRGIVVSHTYYCPHHPKQSGPYGFRCTCRKPKPGMLLKAQRHWALQLSESIMVGDSLSDMRCAQLAGIKKRVLFEPNSLQYRPKLLAPGRKSFFRAKTLRAIQSLL